MNIDFICKFLSSYRYVYVYFMYIFMQGKTNFIQNILIFRVELKIVKSFNMLNALLYVKKYSCPFFAAQIWNPGIVMLDPT